MTPPARPILVIGAGAAGLLAARDLVRAGREVVVLEARDRLGGRIWTLPESEFGYPAEGGAEFVHGAAPVTRAVMREAQLSFALRGGASWDARPDKPAVDIDAHDERFQQALAALETDMPIAQFLRTHFAAPEYAGLRRSITRMVEGYDAADPERVSTLALREEWMGDEGQEQQGRLAQGYGALIDFLGAEIRRRGGTIHLDRRVQAIESAGGCVVARCADGSTHEGQAVILTVPVPVLATMSLPPAVAETLPAVADIGFGNVVKILLRFKTRFWRGPGSGAPDDLSFLFSNERVPTWWTQQPAEYPVLTGWYAGPKADTVGSLSEGELIEMGLASLAAIFHRTKDALKAEIVAARALNWGNDPFARGAYSYATPATRAAQIRLKQPHPDIVIAGEALYAGRDMGTVEAALASGRDAAQAILEKRPAIKS
jgi:monoamine oxidase